MNDLMSLIQNENPCRQLLFLILFDFLRTDTIIQSTQEIMHLGISIWDGISYRLELEKGFQGISIFPAADLISPKKDL